MVDVPDDVAAQIASLLTDIVPTAQDPVVVQNFIDVLTPTPPVPQLTVVQKIANLINDGIANSTDSAVVSNQIISLINNKINESCIDIASSDLLNFIENVLNYE